jgi:hypothetical protein
VGKRKWLPLTLPFSNRDSFKMIDFHLNTLSNYQFNLLLNIFFWFRLFQINPKRQNSRYWTPMHCNPGVTDLQKWDFFEQLFFLAQHAGFDLWGMGGQCREHCGLFCSLF